MTGVDYTEQSLEHLSTLEDHIAERVMDKIEEATEWPNHRLERLSGYPYYKLRVGDYRVIVTWKRTEEVIVVEAVGHRKNIYDRHLPP